MTEIVEAASVPMIRENCVVCGVRLPHTVKRNNIKSCSRSCANKLARLRRFATGLVNRRKEWVPG